MCYGQYRSINLLYRSAGINTADLPVSIRNMLSDSFEPGTGCFRMDHALESVGAGMDDLEEVIAAIAIETLTKTLFQREGSRRENQFHLSQVIINNRTCLFTVVPDGITVKVTVRDPDSGL